MLEINEIFGPTIQGEGKKQGTPSVFVRFGKCNMSCPGFGVEYIDPKGIKKISCDSYYASDSAFKKQWTLYSNANELIKEIDKLIPDYTIDIVFTGGEPLLYWENQEFQALLKHYHKKGHKITIETNGSIDITLEPWHKEILFSLSVKLSNSKEEKSKRLNFQTLSKILTISPISYLKFVISSSFIEQAKKEISEIIQKIPSCEVFVMPLGESKVEIDRNVFDVIEFAIENGYIYSDRFHIRMWDNKRGV